MDIYQILISKPNNIHYLNRYYKFILYCHEANKLKSKAQLGYTENHHICPKAKSLFPEYKKLNLYPWNKLTLTGRQHFISHIILAKAYGNAMVYCLRRMAKQSGINITSRKYNYLKSIIAKSASKLQSNKIWICDPVNNISKFVNKEYLIPNGWIRGRSKSENMSRHGKLPYFNKSTNTVAYLELESIPPDGFVQQSPLKNKISYYDINTGKTKFFFNEEEIPENYVKGSISSKTYPFKNILTGEIVYLKTNTSDDKNLVIHGPIKDKKYYYHPITKHMVIIDPLGEIPDGYIPGNINQVGTYRTRGRLWFISPDKSKTKMFYPGTQPADWIRGRI